MEEAVGAGGLPEAVVNAIGDVARAADSNSWWLLATGVPLLLWEGYTGANLCSSVLEGTPAGAFLVAIGFQVVHGLVVYLLGPKLEKSTSLYGGLGVMATFLFFMWVIGRIVVTAPILNSSLYEELGWRSSDEDREKLISPGGE